MYRGEHRRVPGLRREDKLAHVAYAGEFANGIAGSARAPRTGQVRLSVLLIAASSPRPPVR